MNSAGPRPIFLRDEIYELRVRFGTVNHRVFYFFDGSSIAVLVHAIVKEDRVPTIEIERAIRRRDLYLFDRIKHSHFEEDRDEEAE